MTKNGYSAHLDKDPLYLCSLYLNWNEFLSDKDLVLYDYSFIANQPRQSILGKEKKESKKYPSYHNGLLCFMSVGYFYRDEKNCVQYDSSLDKKNKKLYLLGDNLYIESKKAQDGKYIYIISPKGSIYITKDELEMYHSMFRAGQPVICVGELHIENGKISYINAASGHYKPPLRNLFFSAQWLKDNRYINDDCRIGRINFKFIPEEEKKFYEKQFSW